jgi:hypothetical protein
VGIEWFALFRISSRRSAMTKEEELAVKVTKEIVVKFIEVGRLSSQSFEEVWNQVYKAVASSFSRNEAVKGP